MFSYARFVLSCALITACGAKSALEVQVGDAGDAGVVDGSREDARRDGSVDATRDAPRDAVRDVRRPIDSGFDAPRDTVGDANLCRRFVTQVGPAALELRFLVDRSFSMANETSTGRTKSEELADGFARFFTLPEAAGTYASLTFFPGAPIACSTDRDCVIGRCVMPDICQDESSTCTDDRSCGDLDCVPLGRCDLNPLNIVTCFVPQPDSGTRRDGGTGCPGEIECIDFGYCENGPPWRLHRDTPICMPSYYVSPSVASVDLPRGAPLLTETLTEIVPAGGTPTIPALRGMHRAARTSAARTHRKVVLVLATDTRTLGCDHLGGLATLRREAAAGLANGVPTFVLAILGADEDGVASDLATVSEAGGTELALFSTAEAVGDALVEYLRVLRQEESACIYELPSGARAGLEAVVIERDGSRAEVPQVSDEVTCRDGRGFYFSYDVELGEPVGYVELCPDTCERVSDGGRLEIRNVCE